MEGKVDPLAPPMGGATGSPSDPQPAAGGPAAVAPATPSVPDLASSPQAAPSSPETAPLSRPSTPAPLRAHRVIKLGQSSPPSAPRHEVPLSPVPDANIPPPAAVPLVKPLSSRPPPPVRKERTSEPTLSVAYEEAPISVDEIEPHDHEELDDNELTEEHSEAPPAVALAPASPEPDQVSSARMPAEPAFPAPRPGLAEGALAGSAPPPVLRSESRGPVAAAPSAAPALPVSSTASLGLAQPPRRMPLPPSRVQTEGDPDSDDAGAAEDIDFAAEASAASGEISAGDFEVPPADRKPPPPRRSGKPLLPQAKKPRNKPWWETLFGDDFQRAYRPMTAVQLKREGDFVVESFQLPRGSVLLDLGCGQGELSIELTLRGYSVVGYDLSVYQLAMAGDNAQNAGQKINFLQGDMREMAFDNMFDGVLCWDTSFGYFEEDKNIEILQRIKKALKPGGRLLLDILNRDFVGQQAPYNHWFEGDGCVCMDDMNMDWITNRLRVKRSIILDDGRSKEQQYSIRLYSLSDIGRLLHEVGFRVSAVSGGIATRGAFFGPASRRIIIEAIKPI